MMKRYDWDDYIIIYNEKMVNNVNLRFVTSKCRVLWYYKIITKIQLLNVSQLNHERKISENVICLNGWYYDKQYIYECI